MMIAMEFDSAGGYVTVDRDEWIADRTDDNDDAQAAYDAFDDAQPDAAYQSERVIEWLATLNATGIYGDGGPVQVCSYNEENFLSDDMIMTFAHTEAYGDLFIWQHGYWTDSRVHVLAFNGDDDADAFAWSSGYARCDVPDCDAEWIVESAVTLWSNGGLRGSHKIGELALDDDGRPLCPHDGGHLTFWAS